MKKRFTTKYFVPFCSMTAMLSLVAMTGCVKQEDLQQLQSRMTQQEMQQQQLSSQLNTSQPLQADTWSSVQSIRQEIATLRGQLDDITFQLENYAKADELKALREQVTRHEAALRRIDGQFALELELDAPVPAFVPMPVQNQEGSPVNTEATSVTIDTPAFNGGQMPNDAALQKAGNAESAPASTQQSTNISAPSSATGTFIVPTSTPPNTTPSSPVVHEQAASMPTAQALYDAGIASFHARNYTAALKSFSDFTKVYPDNTLTSNAWFWQGECSYQMEQYPAAALAYEEVISKFPKSAKVPSSLMKQGLCFLKVGKKNAAKARLKDVIKKFPTSPESKRAEQILKENA